MENRIDKSKSLGTERIGTLMKQNYWPAFIGMFINALYNIVDRIYIGQGVGSTALSGLSIIFPILLILMAFGMLFGIGTGVLISIRLGEKDRSGAELTLANGFLMMILTSVFVTILGYAIKDPMLRAFGATEETFNYAQDYLQIILAGSVFQIVGYSLNNVIRSEGNPKLAMTSILVSAVANIILDPIFIFWFDLGVQGAAYATIISMFLMFVWVLRHFIQKKSEVTLHLNLMKPDKKTILSIVGIGMAPFAMQLAGSGVQAVLNSQLITFGGDLAVAANGIIMSVMNLIFMAMFAVNMAAQPIIGYNHGAGQYARVKETFLMSIKVASLISLSAFIIVQAFPGLFIKMFNANDPELFRIGVRGMRIMTSMFFVVGFQVVVGNYFQSTGKAKKAMLLSLLRQVILLTPLFLILPRWLHLDGVWMSVPISDILSATIVFFFFRIEYKRLNRLILDQEQHSSKETETSLH